MTPARGRLPAAVTALIVVAAGLVLAAAAIVAGLVGPLTANPRPAGTPPPAPPAGGTPPPVTPPRATSPPSGGIDLSWLRWIGFALLALIALAILWWVVRTVRRRTRRGAPAMGQASTLMTDVALGSLAQPAEVDLGGARTFHARRAADDIIASFDAVERAAQACGLGRRSSDTPTEFVHSLVARIRDMPLRSDQLAVHTAGLAELLPSGSAPASDVLLRLYQRARFDTVALVPGAATAARAAARELIAGMELSRPAGGLATLNTAPATARRDR